MGGVSRLRENINRSALPALIDRAGGVKPFYSRCSGGKSAYFVFWDSVLDAVAEEAFAEADDVLDAEGTLEGAEDAGAAFGAIASCTEERE